MDIVSAKYAPVLPLITLLDADSTADAFILGLATSRWFAMDVRII